MNSLYNTHPSFAFFGSSRLSVIVLNQLFDLGLIPQFVVTTPDKPVGRKQIITPNVVKQWAVAKKIPVYDPVKLDLNFTKQLREKFDDQNIPQVFLVASFGKIIPTEIIDIPKNKTLNIHPSLLPQYRGPSPLPTAILEDTKNTGVSIMVVDEEMDHGPVIAQKEITVDEWPIYEDFEKYMAKEGAKLFVEILPDWIEGKIEPKEQDHSKASYTKKIAKEDAEIDLSADPYTNFRKIQAYHEWPQAFFFIERKGKKIRIKIIDACYKDGILTIQKVIPEGGKEMSYADYKRGYEN
jgi:methionyl-tRNA formyltransferase